MSSEPPAKFFVNRGIVSSPTDMHHLLRPLLKQTVGYRFYRGHELVDRGTGWVERIVVDHPDVSTYFTPLSICLNIDSFEHLECGYPVAAAHDRADLALSEAAGDPYTGLAGSRVLAEQVEETAHIPRPQGVRGIWALPQRGGHDDRVGNAMHQPRLPSCYTSGG